MSRPAQRLTDKRVKVQTEVCHAADSGIHRSTRSLRRRCLEMSVLPWDTQFLGLGALGKEYLVFQ